MVVDKKMASRQLMFQYCKWILKW